MRTDLNRGVWSVKRGAKWLSAVTLYALLFTLLPVLAHAGPPPISPTILQSGTTTVMVGYGLPGPTSGYIVDASTFSGFTGFLISSSTPNAAISTLTVGGLSANTTYWFQAGALYPGSTAYATTSPSSTVTLANLLSGVHFIQVTTNAITAGWNPSGGGNAAGYVVMASTAANFTGTIISSFTPNIALTTLTVSGLSSGTTYFVEIGAMNWAMNPNFVVLGSTVVGGGGGQPAPINPTVLQSGTTAAMVTWGPPGPNSGYIVDAATAPSFTGVLISSSTPNQAVSTLTVGGLSANTTYFFRAGALYPPATSYANTSPGAIVTLANFVTGTQILQTSATFVTAGWATAGAGNAAGYVLMVSTSGSFTGTITSSTTADITLSTLTVSGLTPGTTYFVRVGALNWAMNPNFTVLGSTFTGAGGGQPAPIAPTILLAGTTTVMVGWGLPGPTSGYIVDASTSSFSGGVVLSSSTTDASASTLTVGGLNANTTYYMRAGALYPPTTAYANTSPASVSTLANLLSGVQILQVSSTAITAGWINPGAGNANGYVLTLSTAGTFTGTLISSNTPNVALTTLTVSALNPSTTYFVRVGALNWVLNANNFVVGSTVTGASAGLAAPTGFNGTATSPTSINWGWGLVGGATGYNLYMATSPTTVVGSTPTFPYSETGLAVNTAYGLVLRAVGGGTQSPLSNSATIYTFANLPGAPTITNVGSSSFTVNWGTAGNPGYTPYMVQLALNNSFTIGVSTPVSFASGLTANTTNIIGLAANTPYFVRVVAQNGGAFATAPSPSASATTAQNGGGTAGGGSGLGSVAPLSPSSVPEGGVVTTTVTFKVPAGGMSAGGRLEIDAPPNWYPSVLQNTNSTQDGYVTATSTAGTSFNLFFGTSTPSVNLSVTSAIPAGTDIVVTVNNIHPSCPAPGQPAMTWEVKSAMSSSDSLADIATQRSQTFAPGPAQWVGYNPWTPLSVVRNQSSLGITIQANDNCGQPALVGSNLVIQLTGLLSTNNIVDPGALFSSTSSFTSVTSTVTIASGNSSAVYFYKTSSTGTALAIQGAYNSPVGGVPQQVWRQVNVLNGAPSLGSITVDTGAVVAGQTSLTLTEDGTGLNNFSYIRFSPSDPTLQWHVAISSNNFQTTVFERWGQGDPQGTISWDGRNYYFNGTAASNSGPQVVPNGTYTVKIEYPNLLADTSVTITVNSAQISGQVLVGAVPVQGAQVNARGVNTPGYSAAVTDAGGNFTLYGLHNAYQYNLNATYVRPADQAVVTGQINNALGGSSGQTFNLTSPAILRVAAVVTSTAPTFTVFGSLNVHTTSYSQNFFGNLRLLSGTTTSDNGDPFTPSSWTILYVQPGSYVIHPFVPGYGAQDVNVTVAVSSDVVITLLPKTNVYGVITLPAQATQSSWVSVEGVLNTNTYPTVFGGVNFNVGQSSAVYSVFSVDPGTYTFRARPPNLVPKSSSGVIVGITDIGNPGGTGGLDFSGFTTGGQIGGQVTVNGDTSLQPVPFTLWISAYSQSLGLNVFTQVQLSTSTSSTSASYQISGVQDGTYQVFPPYLNGFEVSPPGPQSVTVVGSTATLNLTLNQVTGLIQGAVNLPVGQGDYNNVHLSLQGPYSREVDLAVTSTTYTLDHLGTGNYTLTATYLTSGAQIRNSFLLTNGQTLNNQNLNLSASTFSVTGTVSIQNAFSIRDSSNTLVTINTIGDLLASATTQTLTLGAQTFGNGGGATAMACVGGTPITTTTVRVEAFPKNFNSYGNATRNSQNCYGVGNYKYGVIDSSGNFAITGLSAGVWEIDVYPYFDNGTTPNAAAAVQTVTIVNGNIAGVNFPLSSGNSVSGNISLPSGVTDTRSFNVQVVSPRGDAVQSAQVNITAAASVSYQFTGLPAGSYALLIQDMGSFDPTLNRMVTKYVAQPVQFTLTGTDLTSEDITLTRAANIVGKILIQGANPDGTTALTLITPSNQNLLPSNFSINANANPWVPGGYAFAQYSPMGSGIYIDSNNQFHIDGLIAGTYDVNFRQSTFGLSVQGAGSLSLANQTVGSQIVTEGQTLDIGSITLKPGISLSGTVRDQSGTPLSNIRIRAQAANDQHGNNSIEVFTDATGLFTLTGLSPDSKIYTIIAAPRPGTGDSVAPVPYGEVDKLAVDVTAVPAPNLDFALPSASALLMGKVVTADLGSLSYPENDQAGFPEAAVFLHLQGSNQDDNPLGKSNATNLDGTFSIPYLVPGIYDITVESLGYRPLRMTGVTITAGASKDLGTLTLQNGPELDVTITRPDGTAVNTKLVNNAVAATADLTSIIFGKVQSDANTGNIVSIKFSGFELSPKSYNVLFIDDQGNITTPPEGKGITFTDNADIQTRALTYQQSAPFAFANVRKINSDFSITYYFSRPLRNRGDDQDPTQWFLGSAHPERMSGHTISADRRQLTVLYTPVVGELNDTVVFNAHSVDIDPTTGVEFVLNKSLTLLLGQRATSENNVNPALGGNVSLANASDPANINIPSNALLSSTGSAVDASNSYSFTFTVTDDAGSILTGSTLGVGARAAAIPSLMARGAAAYVSEAYGAMRAAAQSNSSVNPLSSFYSVLLPAGLSHTLNQTAYLTLSYDTNADPTQINVYFFDGTKYILEANQRTVDTVNHTITVGVSHFSTFVVLQNNSPVVIVSGASGSAGSIEAFNFPNPFDLTTKTKTLNRGGTTTTLTTDGTIIRYFIPATMTGATTIDIYNVVGEKVRSIDVGVPTGDTFNYVTWDGKNDSGKNVASGVYIGLLKVGGNKATWKMAVIK